MQGETTKVREDIQITQSKNKAKKQVSILHDQHVLFSLVLMDQRGVQIER